MHFTDKIYFSYVDLSKMFIPTYWHLLLSSNGM